jgi:hypothetical protein
MKKSVLAVVVLFAGSAAGFAEPPSPTIAYLLKTPATIMDIGILRLRVMLLEWVPRKRYTDYSIHGVSPATWVAYDGTENRIEVSLHYVDESSEPSVQYRAGVEAECRRVVNDLRELLVLQAYEAPFNHVDNGPVFEIRPNKYNEPPDIYQEVNKITVLKVTYVFAGAKKNGPIGIECDGRMTDKLVSVTK